MNIPKVGDLFPLDIVDGQGGVRSVWLVATEVDVNLDDPDDVKVKWVWEWDSNDG